MAKTTSAESMRALRERRAKDKEQYSEHLEKERIRDKKRRENTKNEAMTDTSLMKELRKRKTMAQRKWRAKAIAHQSVSWAPINAHKAWARLCRKSRKLYPTVLERR